MEQGHFAELLAIVFGAVFINNFVLAQFLGLCPLFGASKRIESAAGMGLSTALVMGISSFFAAILYNYILVPLKLEYLRILLFILLVISIIQLTEALMRKYAPDIHKKLGVYLSMAMLNCVVLGAPLLAAAKNLDVLQSTALGIGGGLGYALVAIIMGHINRRLELAEGGPESFRGAPVAFITMGLLALAFLGLRGVFGGLE